MEDFYAEKYLDTLWVGVGTEAGELFDKSHGFYIAVIQGFFRDYPKVHKDLEGLWSDGQLAVLKKALTAAAKLEAGLLEATEVVELNPIYPNESESHSNLYHCDRDGVYLYMGTVRKQLENTIRW